MTRHDKLAARVFDGNATNIHFDDLRKMLLHFGFTERTRGSHHLFSRAGVMERINLQRDGSYAKAYQVRQVRAVLLKYGLGRSNE